MFTDLPKKIRSFKIKEIGDTTQMEYEGEFKVHAVLNMGQKHALEIEKTILQADTKSPTLGLRGIANTLAELRVRIIDAPDWWKDSRGGTEILDENVIVAIYDQIIDQELKWREELKAKTVKANQDSQKTNSEE